MDRFVCGSASKGVALKWQLIGVYTRQKLSERGTYILALIVGTFINAYAHFLVPWFLSDGIRMIPVG